MPRDIVATYHELPLWNPWACGGMVLLGNPQSRVLTPFFALHLLFGTGLALRLEIVLHLALAFIGAYVLARQERLGAMRRCLPQPSSPDRATSRST